MRSLSPQASASARGRVIVVGAMTLVLAAIFAVVSSTLAPVEADRAGLPLCRDVAADAAARAVSCSTGSTTLTIAPEGRPIVVGRTELRVLRSVLAGRTLRVRLRIRNHAATVPRAPVGRGQLYVRVGAGPRLRPGSVIRSPGSRVTASASFELSDRARRLLRNASARPQLAVVPWRQLGDDPVRHLGIIRLDPTLVP